MEIKAFIVFSSPAGSTRRVAETIQNCLQRRVIETLVLELRQAADKLKFIEQIREAGERACLFIGSPVYRDAAVPPIVDFIGKLPQLKLAGAVPFVTWGQACSGVALWQMADLCQRKGFRILGAVKVVAVHSLMWQAAKPAGVGHPDDSDLREVDKLISSLLERFENGEMAPLALDLLDYQPRHMAEQMKQKIAAPRMIVPKKVDSDKCSCCEICRQNCPSEAIHLDPHPLFNEDCFDCFNCIRLCPEDAIIPAMSIDEIAEHILTRVRTINEQPLTEIFL